MSSAAADLVVGLPFCSAAALALIASWRIGIRINAVSASAGFVTACALPWHVVAIEAHLSLLTGFVAMTTSWFGLRDIPAALGARWLNRRRVRAYHVGFQALIGALQLAILTSDAILSWLALVLAVAAAAVAIGASISAFSSVATSRLVLHGSIGLLLALFGILLLDVAPALSGCSLLLGYGALAGLMPVQSWPVAAAGEGIMPGAMILASLLPGAALLLLVRLHVASALLIAYGLAALLLSALALFAPLDWRRATALSGIAQLGMAMFTLGIGAPMAAWLQVTAITLVRSAMLQSQRGDAMAWRVLAVLPVYTLYLLAGPAAAVTGGLLLVLAAGALLASLAMIGRCPVDARIDWKAAMPVWLQLGLALLLTCITPAPMVAWFRAVAAG